MDYKEQVNEIIAKLKIAFGLDRWTISVRVSRNDVIGINDGFATTDAKYKTAAIDIAPDLEPDRMEHVVYHEMMHVALAEFLAPIRLFAHSLPLKQKEHLDSIIDYEGERFIEQMVPGLINGKSTEE
jgi:hypothetical protein